MPASRSRSGIKSQVNATSGHIAQKPRSSSWSHHQPGGSDFRAEVGPICTPISQEDVNAATATPMCTFDVDGTLIRFTRDAKRQVMVRDALVVRPKNGSWKRQGDVLPVHDVLPPMSEDRVLTGSGRYILLFQNGKAECLNLFTGEPKDDGWLTQRFAEARSIENLDNVRLFLTEDLKHLVVSPMAIWNDSLRKTYEAFDFDGKTYRRADVGLAYSRPSEKPLLFKRHMDKQAGPRSRDRSHSIPQPPPSASSQHPADRSPAGKNIDFLSGITTLALPGLVPCRVCRRATRGTD